MPRLLSLATAMIKNSTPTALALLGHTTLAGGMPLIYLLAQGNETSVLRFYQSVVRLGRWGVS